MKQRSNEVITRLNALCNVKEEKKFEARLKELEKILNDDAKTWLLQQFPEKSKWALAFDKGGSRYEIMTTNISEVFNFILKGNSVENTSSSSVRYQLTKLSCYLISRSLCTRSTHQVGRMSVVRYQEDAYSEWRLVMC
jgi:hypothetical protein